MSLAGQRARPALTCPVLLLAGLLVVDLFACGGGGGGGSDDSGGGTNTTTSTTSTTTTTQSGGGGGATTTTTTRSSTTTTLPSSFDQCPNSSWSAADYAFLYSLNATQLSGHTIRWASVPVGFSAPEYPGATAAFGRWTGASGGRVSFSSGGNITVRSRSTTAWCGITYVWWNSAGRIQQARVEIAVDQSRCSGEVDDTLAHEAGHAIGFLGHASGGLMNPYGGQPISGRESTFMTMLYSLAPGTDIKSCLGGKRRSGYSRYDPRGRRTYSMTIE